MTNITGEDIRNSSIEQKKAWAREGLALAARYIRLAVGMYGAGIVLGLIYSDGLGSYLGYFKNFVDLNFSHRGPLAVMGLIFIHNLLATLISVLSGIVLGLVPAFSAVANGLLLGAVIAVKAGSGTLTDLWKLLPHGIFELPATCIAWGLGLCHGAWLFRKDKTETWANRRWKLGLAFLRYAAPLLIIAAVVEGLMVIKTR